MTLIRLISPKPSPLTWLLLKNTTSTSTFQQQQIRLTSNKSSSSSQYLQRQSSDRFVKAKLSPSTSSSSSITLEPDVTFVARSAFKLLHLQSKWKGRLIKKGMTVIDLGAAPGSWIEATRVEMNKSNAKIKKGSNNNGRIIGVDLLPLKLNVLNLPSVYFIQGNFLNPIIQSKIIEVLQKTSNNNNTQVDLILSDMLSNLTGVPSRDSQLSLDLCQAALKFALIYLTPIEDESKDITHGSGGLKLLPPSLIMKCLRSNDSDEFLKELKLYFRRVDWEKPPSSRNESREGFICCAGMRKVPLKDLKQKVEEVNVEDSIYF